MYKQSFTSSLNPMFIAAVRSSRRNLVVVSHIKSFHHHHPLNYSTEHHHHNQQQHNHIIDGRKWASQIKNDIKQELQKIQSSSNHSISRISNNQKSSSPATMLTPGLAVILVSERPDSATYVRMKRKTADELGFYSIECNLPTDTTTEEDVLNRIRELNQDDRIHGILVQLPLPSHMNEERILSEINPEKDVDGLHPINIGNLSMRERQPLFMPCTPKGVMELLDREGVNLDGAYVAVLGRSNIVGIPMALCLMHRNATVSMCHSKTKNVEEILKKADVIVAACGVPQYVKKEWVKPGVIVIDVGINLISDPSRKSGKRMVGDVDFENVKQVASKITPVPGGVGPMTIAMLMQNTLCSFKRFHGLL